MNPEDLGLRRKREPKSIATPEEKKLRSAVAKAKKALKALSAGDERDWQIADRAISRVESLGRFVSDVEREEAYTLRRLLGPAMEAGREARIAGWNEERKRLIREHRESQPQGFEKELAIMRGRR